MAGFSKAIAMQGWYHRIESVLNRGRWYDECTGIMHEVSIDETITFLPAAKWLVSELTKRGIGFKVHNLPCGVKRITTETDRCPCCNRKFQEPDKKTGGK